MACEDGIMTPETIDELLEMKEKLLYLNKHQNKIWQGKDNKWRTYVRTSNQGGNQPIVSLQ